MTTAPTTNGTNGHRASEPEPIPNLDGCWIKDPDAAAAALATDRRGELAHWWHNIADQDLTMLLPKAAEYSAHDLRMTGQTLADMMGIQVDDAFAAELACAVYLMSKVTRILGAYKEGRLPAVDSIVDARVYATMMARIRERGGWPGWV